MLSKSYRWLSLWLVIALFLPATSALAAEWEKLDEEAGIESFRKEVEGSSVMAFKGVAMIDAPIEKVAWVLFDNEHRTKWVDKLEKSVVLEKRGTYDNVIYQVFGLTWPVADRDYVYSAKAYWKGEKLRMDLKSMWHPKAPKTVGVRAQLKHSFYYLTPKGPNKTHVIVEIHTDPMGILPGWLVNIIQKKWPIKTLSGIRRMVKEPFVEMATLPEKPGAVKEVAAPTPADEQAAEKVDSSSDQPAAEEPGDTPAAQE